MSDPTPTLRVLSEEEATWHQLADESMSGPPASWSAPIAAIVQDSGKWKHWPEDSRDGWWNVRVAQSAVQNLYRCGFAVVALEDPK